MNADKSHRQKPISVKDFIVILATVFAAIGSLIGVAYFLIILLLGFAFHFDCVYELTQSVKSSDHAWEVQQYVIGCGATTPEVTQLYLIPEGKHFDEDKFEPVYVAEWIIEMELSWEDDHSLVVDTTYERGDEVFREIEEYEGISITYNWSY